jgi:hypothetical protein
VNPLKGKPRGSRSALRERFESKCNTTLPPWVCWPWQGCLYRNGYGKLAEGGTGGATLLAHRVSYELFVGSVPEGKQVRHTCDNPPCCNPSHLRTGSQKQNIADMIDRKRAKHQRYAGNRYCTKDDHEVDNKWVFRKRNSKGQFNNEPT